MGHRVRHPFLKPGLSLGVALAAVLVSGLLPPALAQSNGSAALRAANMARMTAEKLNGGLNVYRTAACMHQQSGGSCLIQTSKEGFLFRFTGGSPGWQQSGQPPRWKQRSWLPLTGDQSWL
jgi:hypothetical protein